MWSRVLYTKFHKSKYTLEQFLEYIIIEIMNDENQSVWDLTSDQKDRLLLNTLVFLNHHIKKTE